MMRSLQRGCQKLSTMRGRRVSASIISAMVSSEAFVPPKPSSVSLPHACAPRRPPILTSLRSSSSATKAISSKERLNFYPPIPDDVPFTPTEWEQRCSLAAAYRIAYLHDWHENVFNHITLKVEGSEDASDGPHFLLNDFGIGFDEITACNLLKVNLDGMVIEPETPLSAERRDINQGKGRVFKPGYVLHSAIHAARHDVSAVWHGHDLDASAISQTKFGILPLSQEATYCLNKGVSYHPFEGSANDLSEQPRLVANLGPTNQILMLEDHGPIVACPTIEEAFAGMYFLTRACKYQVKSLSAAGGDLNKIHLPDSSTLDEMVRRMEKFDEAPSANGESRKEDVNENVGTETGSSVEKSMEDSAPKETMHDTPGLMFAYARRSAEKVFGKDSIYR